MTDRKLKAADCTHLPSHFYPVLTTWPTSELAFGYFMSVMDAMFAHHPRLFW